MVQIAFLLLLAMLPTTAWADNCAWNSQVPLDVHIVHANPVYDFSTSAESIQSIADDVMRRVRSGWVLGFTQYQPVLTMSAPVDVDDDGKGSFCSHITHINIAIGFNDETIYIPREIVGAPCGFDEVMAHERKHLAFNRTLEKKYAHILQKEFSNYVLQYNEVGFANVDQARTEMHKNLRTIFDPIAAAMNAEIIGGQGDIDSTDEYNRMMHVCGGELANVVRDVREQRFAFHDGRF
jgi:hypothetical protein